MLTRREGTFSEPGTIQGTSWTHNVFCQQPILQMGKQRLREINTAYLTSGTMSGPLINTFQDEWMNKFLSDWECESCDSWTSDYQRWAEVCAWGGGVPCGVGKFALEPESETHPPKEPSPPPGVPPSLGHGGLSDNLMLLRCQRVILASWVLCQLMGLHFRGWCLLTFQGRLILCKFKGLGIDSDKWKLWLLSSEEAVSR